MPIIIRKKNVLICISGIFILPARKSDQSAVRARLGVTGHLSIAQR